MVDISKPLLPQVRKMNNKEFIAFCRRPRYLENTDGIVLFEENDHLSKNDYPTNCKVIGTTILAGLSYSYYLDPINFAQTFVVWFTLGVVVFWTWMEYI